MAQSHRLLPEKRRHRLLGSPRQPQMHGRLLHGHRSSTNRLGRPSPLSLQIRATRNPPGRPLQQRRPPLPHPPPRRNPRRNPPRQPSRLAQHLLETPPPRLLRLPSPIRSRRRPLLRFRRRLGPSIRFPVQPHLWLDLRFRVRHRRRRPHRNRLRSLPPPASHRSRQTPHRSPPHRRNHRSSRHASRQDRQTPGQHRLRPVLAQKGHRRIRLLRPPRARRPRHHRGTPVHHPPHPSRPPIPH